MLCNRAWSHGPIKIFKIKDLINIMTTCIIVHNMNIEDKRNDNGIPNSKYEEQLDEDLSQLL